jgi:hypothetical protein
VTLHINSFVEDLSFGGETVFFPDLLDVNKGILALAEEYVLERRDRNQIFF